MRRALPAAGALVAGMLATVPGWAAPLEGFRLAAVSPHFFFYSRNGEPIDVPAVERELQKVELLLGHELAGTADYYRYATPQELAANVGSYAAGVTFANRREIHTTRRSHRHEIVHLVAAQLGDPGPFFQEGLAMALESDQERRSLEDLPADLRRVRISTMAARFEGMDPETSYPLAGSFVAFLIRTHGISSMAEFFRACGPSGRDRDRVFRSIFGETLDEAGAAWAGAHGVGGRAAAAR